MIQALIVVAAASAATPPPAVGKPIRSMTYTFVYSTQLAQDQGTIYADVMSVTKDGGLIIRFSQPATGPGTQAFGPADCTVYGDVRVLCQKQGALSMFENELAHLLGRNFVNGNAMDEKNHWHLANSDASAALVDDFTVTSNDHGILNISEIRDFTSDGVITHHVATITYDMNKTVPTHVHFINSAKDQPTVSMSVDLTLQSDSMH